jgi:hypothetical protein
VCWVLGAVGVQGVTAVALQEALAERLDPIDWATYEPYLWGNAARCYQRSAVLLGSLVQVRSPQSR